MGATHVAAVVACKFIISVEAAVSHPCSRSISGIITLVNVNVRVCNTLFSSRLLSTLVSGIVKVTS